MNRFFVLFLMFAAAGFADLPMEIVLNNGIAHIGGKLSILWLDSGRPE